MATDTKPAGSRSGVWAWIGFDFLNSVLVINGTVHFSTWLAGAEHVDPRWYGLAFVASSAVLLFGLPILGNFIDRKRNGRLMMLVSSLAMVACAFAITVVGRWDGGRARAVVALVVFGLMNVLYQASLVAYNWLLVYLRGVKSEADIRRVSGLGEAAGMAGCVTGALIGIGLIPLLASFGSVEPRIDMFVVLGALFLALLLVDVHFLHRGVDDSRAPVVRPRYHRVWLEWFRTLRSDGALRRFFLAFLLFANAVLTVQLFLPIYMQSVMGYSPGQSALAVAGALGGAACGGVLYSRFGPKQDSRWTLLGILALLAPATFALGWSKHDVPFIALLILIGTLYGALWSACRAHLIHLTPRSRLGRSLAFFAVFERSASILGPLVWAGAMFIPGSESIRYSYAISAMSLMVLAGAFVMWRDVRRAAPAQGTPARRRRRVRHAQPT